MRLWQKIFLGSFLPGVFLFYFCGFSSVVTGLHRMLQDEIARTEYYQAVQSGKVAGREAEGGLAGAGAYLASMQEELAGDGRYMMLELNGESVYNDFGLEPPPLRHNFGDMVERAFTPSYMKDIGDTRYLYVESEFVGLEGLYRVTMVKNLASIYASCNSQLAIFFGLCLIQAAICALVMLLISRTITKPVEALSSAARKVADEYYSFRIPVEGQDEIGELTRNFNHMAQAVEDNIESYKRSVANMTHEIKTPLTSIMGYADLACRADCSEEMRAQALAYIGSESKRLNSITRKMIALSRVQPGLVQIARENAAELAGMCVMGLRLKAEGRGVDFRVECDPALYCYVDRELMITVLENLLDNAVKASPQGGAVTLRFFGEAGALRAIEVEDRGAGMPAAELQRIAEPFYTVDNARQRDGDSFGLGLAICKTAMQYHGGGIRFESVPGEYTRAILSFPAARYRSFEQGDTLPAQEAGGETAGYALWVAHD